VVAQLEKRFVVTRVVLGDHAHLYADDTAIDAATDALVGADGVVSVGSGTISDIAKVASQRVGTGVGEWYLCGEATFKAAHANRHAYVVELSDKPAGNRNARKHWQCLVALDWSECLC
jgi:hypothetical protein